MKKLVLFALLILTVGFSSYSGLLSSLKANGAAPISNPLLQQQQQQLQLPDIAFPLRSPSLTPNTTSPNTASVPHAQKTTTITSAVDGNNSLVQNGGTTTSNSITFTFAFGGAGGTTNNNPVVVAPGVTSGNTRYTSGIAGFQCSLDSASPVSCTSPATVHNLAVGNHIFQVRAIDTAGNREANGASFSWIVVVGSGLQTQSSQPLANSPITPSPNAASVPQSQKTTTITSAVDGNNSPVQNGGTTTSNSITFTFAFGGAGGTTNNNPVVVAPGVTSGNTRYTSGIAGFQCSLDSASPVSCTSPATVHNLAVGNHIFQVRAIDTAGNREANGASFSWAVSLSTSSSLQPATTPRPSTTVPSIDGTSTASAAPVNSSITTSTNAMPTSLDSAKAHLAEAMKDIKLGNIQGEVMQFRITNQTITQFQQGMQSIMNVHRTPSALMTDGGNTSQQQAMLNIMNTKGVPSPLMMGNGQGNPHR